MTHALDDYLSYDKLTGRFTWKRPLRKPWLVGKFADTHLLKSGYLYVKCLGKNRLAHRLAWEFVNGPIPEGYEPDHENKVRSDNRIANLRLATRSQNRAHSDAKESATGYRGVSLHKHSGLFRARCKGKTTYHASAMDAALDFNRMAREAFGEFATLNVIDPSGW